MEDFTDSMNSTDIRMHKNEKWQGDFGKITIFNLSPLPAERRGEDGGACAGGDGAGLGAEGP